MTDPRWIRVDADDLALMINDNTALRRALDHAQRGDEQWREECAILRTKYNSLRRALHEAFGFDKPDLHATDDELVDWVRAAYNRAPDPDVRKTTTIRLSDALAGHSSWTNLDNADGQRDRVVTLKMSGSVLGYDRPKHGCPSHGEHPHGGWPCEHCTECENTIGRLHLPDWQPGNWARYLTDDENGEQSHVVQIVKVEGSMDRVLVRYNESGEEDWVAPIRLWPYTPPSRTAQVDPWGEVEDGGPPTEAMPPVVEPRVFKPGDDCPDDLTHVAELNKPEFIWHRHRDDNHDMWIWRAVGDSSDYAELSWSALLDSADGCCVVELLDDQAAASHDD